MEGNFNALGLILVILITGGVLVRYGTWPASVGQVVKGMAAAFAVIFTVSCLTAVWNYEMNNAHQILIPSVCLGLLVIFTRPSEIRAFAVIAAGLSAFILGFHVFSIVGHRYTGS